MVNHAVAEPKQLNSAASMPLIVPNISTSPHSKHPDSFRSGMQRLSGAIAEPTRVNRTSLILPKPNILAAPHSNHQDSFGSEMEQLDGEHIDDAKPSKSNKPWPVMSSDGTGSTPKDEFGSELEDDRTQGCDDASSEASRATEIPIADKLLRSIILAQMRTASGKDSVQMEYTRHWDVIVKKFNWVIEGWPVHVPFTSRRMSNYSDMVRLFSCWESGETRFRKLEEGEFKLSLSEGSPSWLTSRSTSAYPRLYRGVSKR